MTEKNESAQKLMDFKKRMEAELQSRSQNSVAKRAQELGTSEEMIEYLQKLEQRIEHLEKTVEKLYSTRD